MTVHYSYNPAYIAVALVISCLGSYTAIQLAEAAVIIGLPGSEVFSGLTFGWLAIFSLHFISMNAMQMPDGTDWGFDLYLSFVSLCFVTIFGTAALALALRARKYSGTHVTSVLGALRSVSVLHIARSVVLLAIGAVGTHHTGMWSVRGGMYMTLRPGTLVPTLLLGAVVCLVAVTVFLLIPGGKLRIACSVVLGCGIAAFHFVSTAAMEYREGPDFGKGPVLSRSSLVLFVSLQCGVSFLVTNAYSKTVLEGHRKLVNTLDVAAGLTEYITHMDLAGARQLQAAIPDPSPIEQQLFLLIGRLEEFRPYLPDVLLQPVMPDSSDPDTPEDERKSDSTSVLAPAKRRFSGVSTQYSEADRSTYSRAVKGKARVKAPVLSLGLRKQRAVLLLVNYKQFLPLVFGMDPEKVDLTVERFAAAVIPIIREQKGVVVSAIPGRVVVAWIKAPPTLACTCALRIQERILQDNDLPNLQLSQIIVEDSFLVGNIGTDAIRSFTLIGPSLTALHVLDQLPLIPRSTSPTHYCSL